VCLPQAADQFLNAAAGEAAGCAIAIRPGDLSPDAVRAAVARLLDDATIRAGAQRLRDEIASMPPVAEAARRIAALVR
jgi:UDP:flavonoid glycosyltransferase YjiC (YdhE family)